MYVYIYTHFLYKHHRPHYVTHHLGKQKTTESNRIPFSYSPSTETKQRLSASKYFLAVAHLKFKHKFRIAFK
jgi:hypothetical protein